MMRRAILIHLDNAAKTNAAAQGENITSEQCKQAEAAFIKAIDVHEKTTQYLDERKERAWNDSELGEFAQQTKIAKARL